MAPPNSSPPVIPNDLIHGFQAGGDTVLASTIRLTNSNGISFGFGAGASTSVITGSYVGTNIETQTFFGGIAAGVSTQTQGTVAFSNQNNLSFGFGAGASSTLITASFSAIPGETQTFLGGFAIPGSTRTINNVKFSNDNNVSWGFGTGTASNILTATIANSTGSVKAIQAGTQTASTGTVILSASNGIAFGMAGSAITIQGDHIRSVVAGTGTAAGTVAGSKLVFGNGAISFGIAGSTLTGSHSGVITEGQTFLGGLAIGASTQTSGTVLFSSLNNVGFGFGAAGNSTILTASIPAGATATGNFGGVSDSAQLASSGTVMFSDSNGASFAMAGSLTITGNYSAPRMVSVSGGSAMTNGTLAFDSTAGSISWGMNTNANGGTVTGSSPGGGATVNLWANILGHNHGGEAVVNALGTAALYFPPGAVVVVPMTPNGPFPGKMTASTFNIGVGANRLGQAACSVSFSLGLYTLANSTQLSLLNSAHQTFGTGGVLDQKCFNGYRLLSFNSTAWSASPTFSETQYWLAFQWSHNNATDLSIGFSGGHWFTSYHSGDFGVGNTNSTSSSPIPFVGQFSTASVAMPVSMAMTDVRVNMATSQLVVYPYLLLQASVGIT